MTFTQGYATLFYQGLFEYIRIRQCHKNCMLIMKHINRTCLELVIREQMIEINPISEMYMQFYNHSTCCYSSVYKTTSNKSNQFRNNNSVCLLRKSRNYQSKSQIKSNIQPRKYFHISNPAGIYWEHLV